MKKAGYRVVYDDIHTIHNNAINRDRRDKVGQRNKPENEGIFDCLGPTTLKQLNQLA